jgi:hypothetical protein
MIDDQKSTRVVSEEIVRHEPSSADFIAHVREIRFLV